MNIRNLIKLVLIVIVFQKPSLTQSQDVETKNIATFCKVWGFLKYYHPKVAKGKLDWDHEFMSRLKDIQSLNSKDEISNYYLEWLNSLGEIKSVRNKPQVMTEDFFLRNVDTSWISNKSVFSDSLIYKFQFILKNKRHTKNYYVKKHHFVNGTDYKNEKVYNDSIYPSKELRLLGLSRYWNIINYFFPYKYAMDKDWNIVLENMIPKFISPIDTTDYHLAILELTKSINDSHSTFSTEQTYAFFGKKRVPFSVQMVEEKLIVTNFLNDSLCKLDDIRYGDLILSINGIEIKELIRNKIKYCEASNYETSLFYLSNRLLRGNTDSLYITFDRSGTVYAKTITLYFAWQQHFQYPIDTSTKATYLLADSIVYVNMGKLKIKEVNSIFKVYQNSKAIIFDVRNYPNGTMYKLCENLNCSKKEFARFIFPNLKFPGLYTKSNPVSCGKDNNNCYQGQVIILMNETSISHAEFSIMALETVKNCIKVGTNTAGADGNSSVITFPGNFKTIMSGIGVYYPNWGETQRIGIVPDVYVKPTIEGIRSHRDEILDKALELISKS